MQRRMEVNKEKEAIRKVDTRISEHNKYLSYVNKGIK